MDTLHSKLLRLDPPVRFMLRGSLAQAMTDTPTKFPFKSRSFEIYNLKYTKDRFDKCMSKGEEWESAHRAKGSGEIYDRLYNAYAWYYVACEVAASGVVPIPREDGLRAGRALFRTGNELLLKCREVASGPVPTVDPVTPPIGLNDPNPDVGSRARNDYRNELMGRGGALKRYLTFKERGERVSNALVLDTHYFDLGPEARNQALTWSQYFQSGSVDVDAIGSTSGTPPGFCTSCGSPISGGSRFCTGCGKAVGG
jgi:hypothetical protein